MKKMKRLMAYILCFSMVIGLFPMSVAAAETVNGESLEQDVVIEGVTTPPRTVYVLVDSPTTSGKYLISTASGVGESGVVLVKNGNNLSYAEIEVQEGTIHATNESTYEDGYVVLDNANAVWRASRSGGSWNFSNGTSYLSVNYQGNPVLSNGTNNANWSYSNQRLYRGNNSSRRYLYYNNTSWAMTSTQKNIYLYQEVTEESTVGQDVIYKVQAEGLQHILDFAAAGYSNVEQLDYAFLKDGQEMSTLPEGGSFTFEVINDENAIIDKISKTGAVTFNRVEGIADVKISYTWTMDGTEYTAYKYVEVESTNRPARNKSAV